MMKRLTDLPAPEAIEAWFRSVYDPQNKKGDALILDPAFRRAFRNVMIEEIKKADIKDSYKQKFLNDVDTVIAELGKKAPKHSPDEPLPSELSPAAVDARAGAYEAALRDFLVTEKFRKTWQDTVRAQASFDKIEEQARDFYLQNVMNGGNLGPETSPMAMHETVRETVKQLALERIEKAWLLTPNERARLKADLEKALQAWDREQKVRVANRPPGEPRDLVKDDLELNPAQQSALKKKLEEYLKSENFRKCISQPLQLLAISEGITALGAVPTTVMIDSVIDGKGSWRDIYKGSAYADAIHSAELQKQLARNALMMASIGGLRCIHTESLGGDNRVMRWLFRPKNFNGLVLSPMMASMAELSAGKFRPGNVMLSMFWTRVISVEKTALANRLSDGYREGGGRYPQLYYAGAQFISEMIGAVGFPLLARALFGPAPDDKRKKKVEPPPAVSDAELPQGPVGTRRAPQSWPGGGWMDSVARFLGTYGL